MSTYPSAELIARVQQLRLKVADGTITLEEQKEAVILLRQDRTAALTASTASKKSGGGSKPKKVTKSAEDLLAELDN